MTVSWLLEGGRTQASLHGKALIVDEAGMISGRQMEGLLKLTEREHARVVFSGATRQIQSVEASDALRILEHESQMKSVSLTGVQRQVQPEYRDAIQALRHSSAKGFERLEALGAVREVPIGERAQAVAATYRDMTADLARRVLVVAATHEEIGRVTQAIRKNRKKSGQLGLSAKMDRYAPLEWTQAQKADLSNYREGQVLLFHRAVKGIEKHEALEVSCTHPEALIVRNQHGQEKTLTAKQPRLFSVQERQQIDVAPGDKLLLTGNRKRSRLPRHKRRTGKSPKRAKWPHPA